ncbi:MoaD/ThiS family protein [Demequina capsici]|uniref:MoaD/ThiS family protein n=1 Tax=Demequina capsici TaxID=3075620 RepID=A0AA96J7R3_9MICO|nr:MULTISPECIES: MoaD/ThiS family protein [unclassified Demequina]WNM25452.1 MoaD/ThiS family protein [Demequina sp. OYTSA14]WNM28333.1 MoaD/ThiS family protein [Demequina sp. PMTSA13]
MSVVVRLFAGAAEAAGVDETVIEAASAAELREALVRAHGGDLAAVLPRCSLLSDGEYLEPGDAISSGATVDVLPPFAGG